LFQVGMSGFAIARPNLQMTASGIEAEQGSPDYFEDIVGVMRKNPKSTKVGRELSQAFKNGQIEYWEIRAPINRQGEATGIKAREFDLAPR
jgi:hypothetical protein